MARKLVLVLSLFVLAISLTGVGSASLIQITLGPNATGSITTSPTAATFSAVSGHAAQFGGLGNGTYGFLNGNIPVTSANGPVYTLAPNSETVTVSIGSDTLVGDFSLASFTQVSPNIAIFVGTYHVTGATAGFQSTGFWVGSVAEADFVTYKNGLSSGELIPTVPEPGTIAMVGSGLLAIAGFLRRKI
jgi:hypothetical protein